MADAFTLANAPLEHPGMDYAFLRQEGIQWIEALAGSQWTDYNAHDPGITILEALCYALTDLSYRLSIAMEDLLADPDQSSDSPPLFLTARDSLTVSPLTIDDYRKLLIDIKHVNNAWLEPIDTPTPQLYYDANNAKLTFSSLDLAEPINLKGLYRVLLEPEPDYQGQKSDLIKAAKERLHWHRNLCEDFAEIHVLDFEEITVKAQLEIDADVDPQALIVNLHQALAQHISPSLPCLNLQDLLDQGIPVETIFAGPILEHGFIDDQQLQQFDRKAELYTSDLIHILLDLPGIKTVKQISMAGSQSAAQAWALKLDPDLTPRLKSLKSTVAAGDLQFYKGQILCELDFNLVEALVPPPVKLQTTATPIPQDLPLPGGHDRALADYESIQAEFPLAYGIGEIGLPPSASEERKAQAKQLQAYLMVFDQLLANLFAQLDQVKALFSLDTTQIKTYFTQSIAHFPGGQEILQAAYAQYLTQAQVDITVERDRKNRLLEHQLAQYGETFTNYSLLYPGSALTDAILDRKADFAKDYRRVSANRGQAFNYTLDSSRLENFQYVSGLKRRVARLLGIEPARQYLASSDTEGFYMVEHLLLRPQPAKTMATSAEGATVEDEPPVTPTADYLSFAHSITEFRASDVPGAVTCTSENHGLQAGESINIFYSTHYSGTYVVQQRWDEYTFDIARDFVVADTGEWVKSNQYPDPFSFQISVILPDWPARLAAKSVQQLIYDTLIAETPAHITLYVHWFNPETMREFETIYALWLQHLSGNVTDPAEAEASVTRLINFLGLGSTDIPDFPALIGYMVIGDNFVVS